MAQPKSPTVKIRQGEKVHDAFPANQVGPAIRQGKFAASDEFFVEGKGWFRLDKHPKLAPLFKERASPAPETSAPPAEQPEDDDKIKCPACGHRQVETPTCEACGILFEKYFEAKKKRGGRRAAPVNKTEPESISMNPFKLVGPLWRGEFALWVHFWLFGGLGNWLLEFYIMGFIQEVGKRTDEPGLTLSLIIIALALVLFVFWLITLVGIWRSAGNYQGIPMMAVLARIVVFLSLFPLVFGIFFVGTLLVGGFQMNPAP